MLDWSYVAQTPPPDTKTRKSFTKLTETGGAMTDEQVEAAAKAIYEEATARKWREIGRSRRDFYRSLARVGPAAAEEIQ